MEIENTTASSGDSFESTDTGTAPQSDNNNLSVTPDSLNGEEGILRYRGYSIEDLSEKSSFLEVSYLLIYGELPSSSELANFTNEITFHTLVHEDVKSILDGFPSRAHPMGVLSSLVSSLTAFYPKSLDPNRSIEEINGTIIRLIAKLPTLAAWSYKNRRRQPIMYPKNNLDYTSNFLHMMFGLPTTETDINPIIETITNLVIPPNIGIIIFPVP